MKQLQDLVGLGSILNSKHKDTLKVVHWIQMRTHISVIFQGCTWTPIVVDAPRAVHPLAGSRQFSSKHEWWGKGSNAKEQATPFESKFEAQLEHRRSAGAELKIQRPSFAIELCFKFKWGVSVVVAPLTGDKKRLLALIRPTSHSCGKRQFYCSSPFFLFLKLPHPLLYYTSEGFSFFSPAASPPPPPHCKVFSLPPPLSLLINSPSLNLSACEPYYLFSVANRMSLIT